MGRGFYVSVFAAFVWLGLVVVSWWLLVLTAGLVLWLWICVFVGLGCGLLVVVSGRFLFMVRVVCGEFGFGGWFMLDFSCGFAGVWYVVWFSLVFWVFGLVRFGML